MGPIRLILIGPAQAALSANASPCYRTYRSYLKKEKINAEEDSAVLGGKKMSGSVRWLSFKVIQKNRVYSFIALESLIYYIYVI